MRSQQHNIQITGIGLSCATGIQPLAMFDTVLSNMLFISSGSCLNKHSIYNNNIETVNSCPSEYLKNCENSNDRILLNSIIALENALESAEISSKTQTNSNKKCLIYIITPANNFEYSDNIEIDEWYDIFTNEDSPLANYMDLNTIEIKFEPYSYNATTNLFELCKKLSTGEWDTIIFGGIDSLIEDFIHTNGSKKKQKNTSPEAFNFIAGEGSAFLIIEAKEKSIHNITEITKINTIKKSILNMNHKLLKRGQGYVNFTTKRYSRIG